MVYGNETWLLKEDDTTRIFRADKVMFRWMCNVILKDGRSSEEIRDRLGIPDIIEVLRRNGLRWFGYVTRMNAENPASACWCVEVEDMREKGKPRKKWFQVVCNDLRRTKF